MVSILFGLSFTRSDTKRSGNIAIGAIRHVDEVEGLTRGCAGWREVWIETVENQDEMIDLV